LGWRACCRNPRVFNYRRGPFVAALSYQEGIVLNCFLKEVTFPLVLSLDISGGRSYSILR
jgi:hypothetical protein